MILRAILFALLLCHGYAWAASSFEVIPLAHSLADQVAPMVRPFLSPGDVLVPSRNQLIIKTSPEQLAQIKALLKTLDKSPHRLSISVRQGDRLSLDELNAAAGVTVANNPQLRGHFSQTERSESNNAVQQIQTLEGAPAQIQFGESRATTVPIVSAYGNQVVVTQGVGYQELSTGFAVVARLAGDGNVLLNITPWAERPDLRGNNAVRSQQASTSLKARLGEWMVIGGQNSSQDMQQNQLLGHRYATWNENTSLMLKVDDLDAGQP